MGCGYWQRGLGHRLTGGIAGAGLQFVGSDDSFRLRLDACIDHLLTA